MNSPAFLFYSKDWIADTADWEPESKGVYIDLLAHQHVNGFLPSDERKLARIARLSTDEFSTIWQSIKHKFVTIGDHLVNHRLNQVIDGNQKRATKNKINGCFAAKVRSMNLSVKHLQDLKKRFNYEMFMNSKDDEIKESVYKWVDQMVDQSDNNLHLHLHLQNNIDKKAINPPSFIDFEKYFIENGYSSELANRAYKGYEVANWKDSGGKPVKSWKQKCQHVWFRPENQTGSEKLAGINEKKDFVPVNTMQR